MSAPVISHARLLELLSYDPETGKFTWKTSCGAAPKGRVAGSRLKTGYLSLRVEGRTYRTGRLAWFYVRAEWPNGEVDHKNGVRTDDRFENLRPASRSQNGANKGLSSANTSGLKGASFHKGAGKWQATIQVNGKANYLGLFASREQAHAAYIEAARRVFGEFARAA